MSIIIYKLKKSAEYSADASHRLDKFINNGESKSLTL